MGDCLAICDETKPGADGPDPRETPPTEREIEMPAVVATSSSAKKVLIASLDCTYLISAIQSVLYRPTSRHAGHS